MTRRLRSTAALGAAVIAIALTVPGMAAPLPSSPTHVTGVYRGRPLQEVLRVLGKSTGESLTASRSLADQRITIIARDMELSRVCAGLKDLLSAGPEALVEWGRNEPRWELRESLNRHKLREELLSRRLHEFAEFLDGELRWLEANGGLAPLLTGERGLPAGIGSGDRRVHAALLFLMGERSRKALLEGQPVVLDPEALPREGRELIRRLVETTMPNAQQPGRMRVAFLLSASPSDAKLVRVVRSFVTPDGFCASRNSMLTMPGAGRLPFVGPPFRLPPADPADRSRRVTLKLPDGEAARKTGRVWLNLDQCLSLVGANTGLAVIADGYLRSPREFPAGLEIKDYPLHQLLNVLCRTWGCDWRYQGADEQVLLVRSRSWWLEDAADVPEPLVERFRKSLGIGDEGSLDDLLALAELSKTQIHKLVETGICPQGTGIIDAGWYDAAGAQPCLRFVNRLTPQLRARALTAAGFPLKEAPAPLVREWLLPTLIAGVGSITPEEQHPLMLSFVLKQGSENPFGRYELRIWSSEKSESVF